MNKQRSIKAIEDNLKRGRKRYNRGEITAEVWERIQLDCKRRLKQLRKRVAEFKSSTYDRPFGHRYDKFGNEIR